MAETYTQVPGGIHRCYLNDPMHLEYYSDGLCKLMGYTREEIGEILGPKMQYTELIHPDDREIFDESVGSVLIRKSNMHRAVYRVLNRRGEYVTCSCRATVLPGKNGATDLLVGVIETQA